MTQQKQISETGGRFSLKNTLNSSPRIDLRRQKPAKFIVGLTLLLAGVAFGIQTYFSPRSYSDELPQNPRPTIGRIDKSNPLKPLNTLIGQWRGVGQLKRGSRTGAWTEQVTCEWEFENSVSAVVLKSEDGRQFEQLKLAWAPEDESIVLTQTENKTIRKYRGPAPKSWPGRIELLSDPEDNGVSFRCTIQQLSDIRATLLFEQRTSPTGSFRRIAGIGYTRSGQKLAVSGGNSRKCIVTGGLGTIPVTYKGKTYYVCCQGCVQAFNDSPEAIIADYQESLKVKTGKTDRQP